MSCAGGIVGHVGSDMRQTLQLLVDVVGVKDRDGDFPCPGWPPRLRFRRLPPGSFGFGGFLMLYIAVTRTNDLGEVHGP